MLDAHIIDALKKQREERDRRPFLEIPVPSDPHFNVPPREEPEDEPERRVIIIDL